MYVYLSLSMYIYIYIYKALVGEPELLVRRGRRHHEPGKDGQEARRGPPEVSAALVVLFLLF